ncbi:MAG: response regulator [Pseudolabrys sp.]
MLVDRNPLPAAPPQSDGTCHILLVEDDRPVRERMAGILSDWSRARSLTVCATLAEALSAIAARSVDLLVTDLRLPDGNGVEAIRALRTAHPNAEAMVISALADDGHVIDAIEAGAAGYLLKDSAAIDIIDAVSQLLAGGSPISPGIARTIVRRLGDHAAKGPPAEASPPPNSVPDNERGRSLTEREMDILWGIAKGFTYAEIAQHLQISKHTVPVHIKNIYRKLHVNNRSEAVYEASRRGLIRL